MPRRSPPHPARGPLQASRFERRASELAVRLSGCCPASSMSSKTTTSSSSSLCNTTTAALLAASLTTTSSSSSCNRPAPLPRRAACCCQRDCCVVESEAKIRPRKGDERAIRQPGAAGLFSCVFSVAAYAIGTFLGEERSATRQATTHSLFASRRTQTQPAGLVFS